MRVRPVLWGTIVVIVLGMICLITSNGTLAYYLGVPTVILVLAGALAVRHDLKRIKRRLPN
jgi:hypothetical protein